MPQNINILGQANVHGTIVSRDGVTTPSIELTDNSYIGSASLETASTSLTVLFSFNGSQYNSGTFKISAKCLDNIHSSEIIAIWNNLGSRLNENINLNYQEYAIIKNSISLYVASVQYDDDLNIQIMVTSTSSSSTKYIISYVLHKV